MLIGGSLIFHSLPKKKHVGFTKVSSLAWPLIAKSGLCRARLTAGVAAHERPRDTWWLGLRRSPKAQFAGAAGGARLEGHPPRAALFHEFYEFHFIPLPMKAMGLSKGKATENRPL